MESIFLLNSSCSCAGPCTPCNSKSRTYRSGNDRSSSECFHFLIIMPNVGRDTAVSAKLMYNVDVINRGFGEWLTLTMAADSASCRP